MPSLRPILIGLVLVVFAGSAPCLASCALDEEMGASAARMTGGPAPRIEAGDQGGASWNDLVLSVAVPEFHEDEDDTDDRPLFLPSDRALSFLGVIDPARSTPAPAGDRTEFKLPRFLRFCRFLC
jgi:hypothetical protein